MSRIRIHSPLGPLRLIERDGRLAAVIFGAESVSEEGPPATPLLSEVRHQLTAYFAGMLKDFSLPLAPAASPFQERLRAAMLAIPYGETRTYGVLAHELGSSARAIGGGCGRNPLPLVVPCHRVLAAGAALGGYSGGRGLETKRALLALEGSLPSLL